MTSRFSPAQDEAGIAAPDYALRGDFNSVAKRPRARYRINQGKIKPAVSYEFIERADELQPQAGSSRSGGPRRKLTLAGVLNPQNCPQCGQRFPSKIEESAMRKTRAKDPDEWDKLRQKISYKVCTCPAPTST